MTIEERVDLLLDLLDDLPNISRRDLRDQLTCAIHQAAKEEVGRILASTRGPKRTAGALSLSYAAARQGGNRKFTRAQAAEIARKRNQGTPINALAHEYDVSIGTIRRYLYWIEVQEEW